MAKTRKTMPKATQITPPPVAPAAPTEAAYRKGDLVQHPQFGKGKVVAVEASKLSIAFDKPVGTKLVIDSYVKPG